VPVNSNLVVLRELHHLEKWASELPFYEPQKRADHRSISISNRTGMGRRRGRLGWLSAQDLRGAQHDSPGRFEKQFHVSEECSSAQRKPHQPKVLQCNSSKTGSPNTTYYVERITSAITYNVPSRREALPPYKLPSPQVSITK
jgi:hypothetical protein